MTKTEKKPELKPVDAASFFSSKSKPKKESESSRKHCKEVKPSSGNGSSSKSNGKTRKGEPEAKRRKTEDEIHDDEDFSAMLRSMDEDDMMDFAESKAKEEKGKDEMKEKKKREEKGSGEKKKEPRKKVDNSEKQVEKQNSNGAKLKSPEKKTTPKKELSDTVDEIPGTPQESYEEQKKKHQMQYRKFLSRGGARNPGSKPIPQVRSRLEGLLLISV